MFPLHICCLYDKAQLKMVCTDKHFHFKRTSGAPTLHHKASYNAFLQGHYSI